MQADVFDRLKLERASFEWSPQLKAVTAYDKTGQPSTRTVHLDQAAGGLYISVKDLATFFSTLLPGGDNAKPGRGLLQPDNVAQMFTPIEKIRKQYGFGYFVEQLKTGQQAVWHDGIGFGARSIFMLVPATGEGIVIVTNSGQGNQLFKAVFCAWNAWAVPGTKELCGEFRS
jgi:CubicO group peptidase (beta-lactamase class C family)